MQESQYKAILSKLNYSVAEHELVYDESGTPIDYKYTFVNDFFCESLGVKEEDVLGENVFTLFPLTERFWLDTYAEVVFSQKEKDFIHYSENFDKYFAVFSFPTIKDRFVTTFQDVTEYIKSESDLTNNKELVKTFTISSRAAFFDFDLVTKDLNFSETLPKIIGTKEITIDRYLRDFYRLIHPEDGRKVAKINHNLLKGKVDEVAVEYRFLNEDTNEYIWLSYFAYVSERKKHIPVRIQGIIRDITDEKSIQIELDEHERLFAEARKIADITTLLYHTDTETFEKSEELSDFLGIKGIVTLEKFRSIVHEDDINVFDSSTEYILKNRHGGATYRIFKNNEIRYIQSSLYAITNDQGESVKISGILRDVTDEEINRINLEKSRQQFMQIFNTSPEAIFTMDKSFNIILRNNRFGEFASVDYSNLREILKKDFLEVEAMLIKDREVKDFEFMCISSIDVKHLSLSIVEVDIDDETKYQATMMDLTERIEAQKRIEFLATRDLLTKIYNRNYFEEETRKLSNKRIGVIICDIDGLKLINDAFGHLEGDKLLIQFSAHLNTSFPDHTIARIGGDEFAILCENPTIDNLEKHEEIIKEYTSNLYMFGISIDVSVGYAIKEKDEEFYDAFVVAENIMYRRKLTERSSRKSNALNTIMQTLHEKTHETEEHCKRVGDYAEALLKETGRQRTYEAEAIKLVALVHDIGKIATPQKILDKPRKLNTKEYKEIQHHSEAGFKIVTNILNNDDIAMAVLYHHERYDGTGYPHNLKGEEIPLYARILSICDAYDTMVSGRVYRSPISVEQAQKELLLNKGTQFDPELVDLFISYINKK